MLSAFAARKARLQQNDPQESSSNLSSPSRTPSEAPGSRKKPTARRGAKRKPVGQAQTPSKKSRKEGRRADDKKARYFEENAFKPQQDVIIIDREDEDEDEELNTGDEGESVSPPRIGSPGLFQPVVSRSESRAWSPSNSLPDSSDEEEGEAEEMQGLDSVPNALPPDPDILSTFRPILDQNTFDLSQEDLNSLNIRTDQNYEEAAKLLVMSPSETLTLLGSYSLTVLHGPVSLCGTTLSASPIAHRVYAPRCSPLPVIQSVFADGGEVRVSLSARIRGCVQSGQAVIVLRTLKNGVEGLGNICRVFDRVFEPSRWHANSITHDLGLPGMHILTHHARDVHTFTLPASWEDALTASLPAQDAQNLNPIVCLVKGPKKVGKSTFARTLMNRLLTRYRRVAFLECDVGQSEFTPGGMVALNVIDRPQLGPPFTHPTLPYAAHYIGATSPRSSPSHYISAIQVALQSYRLDVQYNAAANDVSDPADPRIVDVIPIIVNTMGWTKGLGADLTRKIVEMVEPTDIFEMEVPVVHTEYGWGSASEAVGATSTSLPSAKRYILEPIPPTVSSTNYTAADHRTISILSYFHAVFPYPTSAGGLRQSTAIGWTTSLPLCAQSPYEVNWSVALDRVFLTGADMEDVVGSEVLRVLNGAVVGLVECEEGALDEDVEMRVSAGVETVPYTQGALPPSPSLSTCHGLALIRAVSATSPYLQIVTPLPPFVLSRCRAVVKGELELPVWGMLDYRTEGVAGVERAKVPYLRWGKEEGLGGEKRRVRRNLMRKGQM